MLGLNCERFEQLVNGWVYSRRVFTLLDVLHELGDSLHIAGVHTNGHEHILEVSPV